VERFPSTRFYIWSWFDSSSACSLVYIDFLSRKLILGSIIPFLYYKIGSLPDYSLVWIILDVLYLLCTTGDLYSNGVFIIIPKSLVFPMVTCPVDSVSFCVINMLGSCDNLRLDYWFQLTINIYPLYFLSFPWNADFDLSLCSFRVLYRSFCIVIALAWVFSSFFSGAINSIRASLIKGF